MSDLSLRKPYTLYMDDEVMAAIKRIKARERAEIGAQVSMDELTASTGFYTSPWGKHRRNQLVTIAELLNGKGIDRSPQQTSTTFKRARKAYNGR